MRPRGTTLVELTVTIFVFSIMMTLILGFYIYGTRITDQRNTISDNYRRAVRVADRIETLIGDAWIHEVGSGYVIFSRLDETAPIAGRRANWSLQTSTLYVDSGAVWLREPAPGGGFGVRKIDELDALDSISFADDQSTDTPRPGVDEDGLPVVGNPSGLIDYVDVGLTVTSRMETKAMKPGEIGTGPPTHTLSFTRRILVERP